MGQHTALSPERWRSFTLDQQLLMIANEMNRASKLFGSQDAERLKAAYERALQLTDLTVAAQNRPALRRELLRWRGLIAQLYIEPIADLAAHSAAFRCLLRFTPTTSTQLPHVTLPASV